MIKLVGAASACLALTSMSSATTYKYTVFNYPGQQSTLAFGINAGGEIAGGSGPIGYVNTEGSYIDVAVPGAVRTTAYGINDKGQVVGFCKVGERLQGFLKTAGTYVFISAPGASQTFVFGIDKAGRIVGTYSTEDGQFGYEYVNGTYTTIAVPDADVAKGRGTQAHGINGRGQIVGFYNQGIDPSTGRKKVGGYMYENGVFKKFEVPGAYATEANGINNAGQIVGTYGNASGGFGFVLTNGAFATLMVPGATKTEAQGVSELGVVVGWAVIDGKMRGFVATPSP